LLNWPSNGIVKTTNKNGLWKIQRPFHFFSIQRSYFFFLATFFFATSFLLLILCEFYFSATAFRNLPNISFLQSFELSPQKLWTIFFIAYRQKNLKSIII
jgi:hypothetical protein